MKYSVKKSIKEYGATAMFICCCILSMLIDLSQFFQIETFSKFNSFLFVISLGFIAFGAYQNIIVFGTRIYF